MHPADAGVGKANQLVRVETALRLAEGGSQQALPHPRKECIGDRVGAGVQL